jgi:arylsulfatase
MKPRRDMMADNLNVLFVISDQHHAGCIGSEGHPQAMTPNLDRLTRMGVRFRHAYTQNTICTPSRVSILSGQYCHNHGYYGLAGPRPNGLPSFLSHFRQHSYRTAGIGKLHTPNDPHDWLIDHVDLFDECYTHGAAKTPSAYFQYLQRLGLCDKEDSIRIPELPGEQQLEGRASLLPYEHCVEGWCVSEAIKFIDQSKAQPFCMEVSLPRPHQCYTPDKRFWDLYPDDLELPDTFYDNCSHRTPDFRKKVQEYRSWEWCFEPKTFEAGARRAWRGYLAAITQVDHSLGLLMNHLEKQNLLHNTIIIYDSDHGAYSGQFGVPEKAPGICSEAVCRVPLIWYVPGLTRQGHVSNELVENIDIPTTIASLCGLAPMETTDGKDITSLLQGSQTPVRQVAVTENPWSKSIRWENWRLVHYPSEMYDGQDFGELYDIHNDPKERNNLYRSSDHQPMVNQGRKLLLDWLIGTTRNKTIWPTVSESGSMYDLAADGKEVNWAGPRKRKEIRSIAYL